MCECDSVFSVCSLLVICTPNMEMTSQSLFRQWRVWSCHLSVGGVANLAPV